MGYSLPARYRGFSMSVHTDPASPEYDFNSSIVFVTAFPGNDDISEFEQLKMRRAISLEAPGLSEEEQQEVLLARARDFVDDYYSGKELRASAYLSSGSQERRGSERMVSG